MTTQFFALTLIIALTGAQTVTPNPPCIERGYCEGATFLRTWDVTNTQDCLELCQSEPNCSHFTFFEFSDLQCIAYSDCDMDMQFNNDRDSSTGPKTCPDVQCSLPGSCSGAFVDVTDYNPDSEGDCRNHCQTEPDCNWYTYDQDTKNCIMLERCESISAEFCPNCLSGQVQCPDPYRN